ncbi:MAG: wyosine [tRNA(Phe)-imidazoG37] synthetase (radical SAM superfamily) [Planctomycetota bacterium]|jgi:wyosine [tRNA(Phe)-imidazoG37] synthetase (radical SAM superfamily)
MVVLNPESVITGPARSERWARALRIDLGTLNSTLAISRENRLPRSAVVVTLAAREMMRISKAGEKVDNIVVFGSEVDPTRHPGFREISENLRALRAKWFPRAKLALISNDPQLSDMDVRISLGFYDKPVIRLEHGTVKTYQKLTGHKSAQLTEIVHQLSSLEKVIIQAEFISGEVDNSTEAEVKGWIKRLRDVKPLEVFVSSPSIRPKKGQKPGIAPKRLKEIAAMVTEEIGATVTVLDKAAL